VDLQLTRPFKIMNSPGAWGNPPVNESRALAVDQHGMAASVGLQCIYVRTRR